MIFLLVGTKIKRKEPIRLIGGSNILNAYRLSTYEKGKDVEFECEPLSNSDG